MSLRLHNVSIIPLCNVAATGTSRPLSESRRGSGKFHHGYGYDPNSDGWKVDCSTGTQKSFSTYTVAKPEVWVLIKP